MATQPKYDDKIVAGSVGAILYGDVQGNPWNWDGQPVRLGANDYLYSTGVYVPDAKQGPVYEVYIWRYQGNRVVYKTREEASRGGFLSHITLSKLNQERRYLLASDVIVTVDSANDNKSPDSNSPVIQEQAEKASIDERLKTFVYDKNPNQIKHSSLAKGADDWILTFPNGNSVPFKVFLAMTTTEQQNVAKVDLKTGLTDNPTTTTTKTETASLPVWVYAIVGVVVTAVLGLFMLSKPKSKK